METMSCNTFWSFGVVAGGLFFGWSGLAGEPGEPGVCVGIFFWVEFDHSSPGF